MGRGLASILRELVRNANSLVLPRVLLNQHLRVDPEVED